MTKFNSFYIDEPDLIFGNLKEEKDPKIGIQHFGPYFSAGEKEPSPTKIRVGVIGTGELITLTKQILDNLKNEIKSNHPNKWLYPDFPGFNVNSVIKCEFISSDRWQEIITQGEIKQILAIQDVNQRISAAAKLYSDKVEQIASEDDTPIVIICVLPKSIEDFCGISQYTRGAKRPKFTPEEILTHELKKNKYRMLSEWGFEANEPEKREKSFDLRNSIKGKIMGYGIPVQLLRESTIEKFQNYTTTEDIDSAGKDPSTFAWNFATGIYYKANGRPWRLAKLTPGSCYIGISFYRNLRNPDLSLETSMAQVFTHSGDGFVLRGSDVIIDKDTLEPHLSKKQASDLLSDVLGKYRDKVKIDPIRVVIHKSTIFSEDEKAGFSEVIGKKQHDFVAINPACDIRLLRFGQYPVLRGTAMQIEKSKYLLYSSGYIPRVRTYPGARIPSPLIVIHDGDSEIQLICQEILGLTKLNWNTTSFATKVPITIDFAKRVGRILSELDDGQKIQDHYRFYM